MSPVNTLKRAVVVAVIGLCCASALVELMSLRAEDAVLESHQKRWDCWAEQSHRVPRCVELAKLNPEDADYCSEAVSACKASGAYDAVVDAEARQFSWRKLGAAVRLLWLVATFSFLVWVALVQPIRRLLRSVGQ